MEDSLLKYDVLVVGAGIAGISTALETAETGFSVVLAEKNPYIGGRVAQLNQYFPKLCPPTCGLEINIKRLKDNPKISLHTMTEVESVDGEAGNYTVKLKINPRFVTRRCTACGDCEKVCYSLRTDDFNLGMSETKAVYLPFNNAYPMQYVLDKKACSDSELRQIADSCKYHAIDLNQKEEHLTVNVKSIVWATGWKPYDAKKLDTLGFGKYQSVITNLMLERLSAPNGHTGGKITIPGTDKPVNSVAFVQCAGSRDENHLEYCSSVCCLASMKQALYIREQYPQADIHVFYIDIRSPGMFEDFYTNTKKDEKIFFHRGKVAKVIKENNSDKLIVEAEDTLTGVLRQATVDMVVLATGMQPVAGLNGFPDKTIIDDCGFIKNESLNSIIACGVASSPKDVASTVQESTAAAIRAIHIIKEND